jgi:hypothetical protein
VVAGKVVRTVHPKDPFFVGFVNMAYDPAVGLIGLAPHVEETGYCSDGCFSIGILSPTTGAYKQLSDIPFKAMLDDSHYYDPNQHVMFAQGEPSRPSLALSDRSRSHSATTLPALTLFAVLNCRVWSDVQLRTTCALRAAALPTTKTSASLRSTRKPARYAPRLFGSALAHSRCDRCDAAAECHVDSRLDHLQVRPGLQFQRHHSVVGVRLR